MSEQAEKSLKSILKLNHSSLTRSLRVLRRWDHYEEVISSILLVELLLTGRLLTEKF